MIIRCIVAAINSNGEPDLYFCKVGGTQEQYHEGLHYDTAMEAARNEGYEPKLVYDEYDNAGKAMLVLFHWDTTSTINVTEIPA